jgi:hypothetical protein
MRLALLRMQNMHKQEVTGPTLLANTARSCTVQQVRTLGWFRNNTQEG